LQVNSNALNRIRDAVTMRYINLLFTTVYLLTYLIGCDFNSLF